MVFSLIAGCSAAPRLTPYDPACFAETLRVGVSYSSPRNAEERLLPRHELGKLGNDSPERIITLRVVGPYSEPEMQLTIFEMRDGSLRGEFVAPVHCSIDDQLYAMFVRDPKLTDEERIARVRMRRITLASSMPEIQAIDHEFRRLRISADLQSDIVLDARIYHLWVETPENTLELHTVEPDTAFARWADRTMAILTTKYE